MYLILLSNFHLSLHLFIMITVVCNPRCEFGACVANDTCKCSQGYTGKSCSEKGLVHYTPTHSGSPHLLLFFFIQLWWLVRKTFVKMVGLAQDMSMTTLVNVLLVTLASPVKKTVYEMWQYLPICPFYLF